jgi:hypothetical protein
MRCEIPEGETEHWAVERFTVSGEDERRGMMRACNPSSGGRYVPKGTYTRLVRQTERGFAGPMMSDTPDEIHDHLFPLMEARGVCLVTGLGLGCVVKGMLEKRDEHGEYAVEKVIVIEIEAEIIALVGPWLKEKYGDRLEIRHADALTYKAPVGEKYDTVWHDIWPDICEDNLDTMATLHRKYGRRCRWQGSWQRSYLQRMRREGRRYSRAWGW